jgi:phage N-6-adenine-methyltransferase
MGRGLSPLQWALLETAWRNREAGRGAQWDGDYVRGWDAHYHELLTGYYGLEPAWRHRWGGEAVFRADDRCAATARAAISRAAKRLDARGLIYWMRHLGSVGIILTEAGEALAGKRYAPPPPANHQRLHSSAGFEWITPPWLIALAREVMGGIELDAASCAAANGIVGASRYFSLEESAFDHEWRAATVWLNPPYCRLAPRFVAEALKYYRSGAIGQCLILVSASTEARWFESLCAYPIILVRGRVAFADASLKPKRGNPKGSAVCYLGPHIGRFREVFGPHGTPAGNWEAPATLCMGAN